jgi:DNA excision repair protein ERCC-2
MFAKQKDGFVPEDYFDKIFSETEVLDTLITAGDFILENEKKKPNLFKIGSFMASWQTDKKVKTRFKNNDTISIKGLDPAFLSSSIFDDCFGAILMSATFSPLQMYVDVLGIKKPYIRQYESPFPKENKLVQYVETVTTKYDERKESLPEISQIVKDTINKVSGNIAVFFPSYDVLQSVLLRVSEKTIKKIYVQEKNMTANETKRLIDMFKKNKVGFGSVLFAVVGGSFSEGVDYPGDDLIGILMVGFPFPEPDYEMESLIKFYDDLGKSGWNYAYLFPTVSKVVQACGRGIRSETDKAFILLLDKRFGWTKYKSLFPLDYNIQKYDQKKLSEFVSKM